jgi:AraC-like DNA-binding protein
MSPTSSPSPLELTGIARLPLSFLRVAAEMGVDPAILLQRSGLVEEQLRDPDARVPLGPLITMWRVLIEMTGSPTLGLDVGRSVELRELGIVGYSMYYSTTLGQAVDRLSRYCRIVSEIVNYEVRRRDSIVIVRMESHPLIDALRHPIAARLTSMLAWSREMTGKPIRPVEVRFSYRPPAKLDEFERFFQAPLKLDCSYSELVLESQALDLPVKAADPTLSGYLDKLAELALAELPGGASLVGRVRHAIWTQLSSGAPTVAETARQIGQSPRTLQRRLREEGATFAELLEQLRREMAPKLLSDTGLAVYEVAFLLGYSEPSTFYRAFRRWTGRSPHEFRRSVA